jgi:dTDP-4-dehydrorhamnose 3,5-epimerase-like enzyme
MSLIEWIDFPPLGDSRGSLVAVELGRPDSVPFDVNRIYYIYGTGKGVSRGFHAHRDLEQVAICLVGRCRFVLDDGRRREEAWLDSPNRGLRIGRLIWREMHDFSDDCILLVLASDHYDESDYIRSHEDFKRVVQR